jgi:cation diffusion facilitator CzcD-associated flavoprotein CzcO
VPNESDDQPGDDATAVTAVIVGCGFGGIAVAEQFTRDGMDDFVIVERGQDVGGTWRDNTYPGAACDVPSHLYSFSFAPNPDWSSALSPQAEIQTYLQNVARSVGVYERCRFGAELTSARWDDVAQRWTVRTTAGDFRARFLISAAGPLSDPATPALPGIERFAGKAFHSARWDHDHELTGERVAVIGTGASAIQFIPRIAARTLQLLVFQRTAPWVIARHDRAYGPFERWVYRHVPAVQRLARAAIYWGREGYVVMFAKVPKLVRLPQRMARRHLRSQVADADLRRRLTPSFTFGCKRVLMSNDYYPTLARENVQLVTEAIREVRAHSIVTTDGREYEVDTIVYATGFQVTDVPIAGRIVNGEGTSLAERWRDGMSALYGSTVAGFPNLFLIIGPNTGLGHTSMVVMIEANAGYVADAIRQITARGLSSVQPREPVLAAYNAGVQRQLATSVWNAGGCRSWYLDARGHNTTLWPDFTFRFRRRTRRIDLAEYETVRRP